MNDDAYIELSGERSGHQYGIAQDPASLVPRLKHLISLDDPRLGGPYDGVAARACLQAMRDAVDELERLTEHSTKLNGLMWKIGEALGYNSGFTKVLDVDPDALVAEAVKEIASKRPRQWVYLVLLPVERTRFERWVRAKQRWILHDDDWNAWGSKDRAEQSARGWRKDELTRVVAMQEQGCEVVTGYSGNEPLWRVLGVPVLRSNG